jgi:predicted nucleic acid-binding protein
VISGKGLILVDTSYWIALFDERDQRHTQAREIYGGSLQDIQHRLSIAWPATYELINTRFFKLGTDSVVKRRLRDLSLLTLIDDSAHKLAAYQLIQNESALKYSTLSLVDAIQVLMIKDIRLNISTFVTFDTRSFDPYVRDKLYRFS